MPVSDKMYLSTKIRYNRQQAALSIMLDTGAESSLISFNALTLLGKLPKLSQEQVNIKSANGSDLLSLGTVALFVRLGERDHLINFHVIKNLVMTARGRTDIL